MLIARYEHSQIIRFGRIDPREGSVIPLAVPPSAAGELGRIGVAALGLPPHLVDDGPPVPLHEVRILAPVPQPGKILCLGGNYAAHVREAGQEAPDYPNVFAKFPSSIIGPTDVVELPEVDSTVDFEGELCVVIGRRAKHLTTSEALDFVLGYTVADDVTARTWQTRGSQWTLGKSFDTFCPIGPWVATADEIGDPQNLRLRTTVNGLTMQDASTSAMIVSVADVLVYVTAAITLEPGDLLLTGTPEGIGHARVPPVYLREGDVVEVAIDGIGSLRNEFRAAQKGVG